VIRAGRCCNRRQPAAPGDELDRAVGEEGLEHVDAHPAHEPEVLGRSPAGLVDVVDRDLLQEPGDGVEPEPAPRVHVG
jgi:hypothetical protein